MCSYVTSILQSYIQPKGRKNIQSLGKNNSVAYGFTLFILCHFLLYVIISLTFSHSACWEKQEQRKVK